MRALVVEDDRSLARQLAELMRGAGWVVGVAHDGREGHFLGDTEPYDVVVLDLGLPELDGLGVLERWRATGRHMPVLILSARGSWREKVTGLRAGADDYLAKPFEPEEMLARTEALLRRAAGSPEPMLYNADIVLDPASRRVTLAGDVVRLTALEYRLLACLMRHADRVVSKSELVEHIYGQDFDRDSNTVEVIVNRLRKKLGANCIRTLRGHGYRVGGDDD